MSHQHGPTRQDMQALTQELQKLNRRNTASLRNHGLNLMDGLFRGLGFALGATLLFGLGLTLLSRMVSVPLVGKYVAAVLDIVEKEKSGKPGLKP